MTRRLFTLAALLSLALFLATAVLWVRSYSYYDSMGYGWSSAPGSKGDQFHLFTFTSYYGSVSVAVFHWPSADKADTGFRRTTVPDSEEPPRIRSRSWVRRLGFELSTDRHYTDAAGDTSGHGSTVRFPLWLLAGVLLIPPIRAVLATVKQRVRSGCGTCGYNLTGNTSGVCPECGTDRGMKLGRS